MDYLSAMLNNFGYVLTVEKLLGVEILQRAQVIRVMMTELQRIASHLFWLSTHVLDVSGTGMSLLMYATASANAFSTCSRWCAVRVSRSATRLGGVCKDLPDAFLVRLAEFLRAMPARLDDYERMLTDAPLWDVRLRVSAFSAATRSSTWG